MSFFDGIFDSILHFEIMHEIRWELTEFVENKAKIYLMDLINVIYHICHFFLLKTSRRYVGRSFCIDKKYWTSNWDGFIKQTFDIDSNILATLNQLRERKRKIQKKRRGARKSECINALLQISIVFTSVIWRNDVLGVIVLQMKAKCPNNDEKKTETMKRRETLVKQIHFWVWPWHCCVFK